jgi:hypothetical protein
MNRFRVGDKVQVSPWGVALISAAAAVMVLSGNRRSIGLAFGNRPRFILPSGGGFYHPVYGFTLLALRDEPGGPYVDTVSGEKYEVIFKALRGRWRKGCADELGQATT